MVRPLEPFNCHSTGLSRSQNGFLEHAMECRHFRSAFGLILGYRAYILDYVIAPVRDLNDLVSEPLVLLLRDADVMVIDVVLLVSVKAGAHQDDVWLEARHSWQNLNPRGSTSGSSLWDYNHSRPCLWSEFVLEGNVG